MKRFFLVLLFGVCLCAIAQDKPADPPKPPAAPTKLEAHDIKPLTPEEKLALRSSQVKGYELREQKRNFDAQIDAQIADSDKGTQQTVDAIYAARKITRADAILCENPVPNSPCAAAPAGDLSLQAVPKTEKEAKK